MVILNFEVSTTEIDHDQEYQFIVYAELPTHVFFFFINCQPMCFDWPLSETFFGTIEGFNIQGLKHIIRLLVLML